MMTKIIQTSVNLLLKTLLHSLKSIIHLLPICLEVGVEPGLHLLKLRVHGLLNISKISQSNQQEAPTVAAWDELEEEEEVA
jgi:hypothetical protein